MKREVTSKIILHCSANANPKVTISDIKAWQTAKDFPSGALPDVAYHYFIRAEGQCEAGLPEDQKGYHTKGQNYCSIAICLHGPLSGIWPAPAQAIALKKLLGELVTRYPHAEIYGHRNFRPDKLCPAFDYDWVQEYWAWLKMQPVTQPARVEPHMSIDSVAMELMRFDPRND
jgi:N-acetyl-anhydromuramyl-L-alanine amidase AmpD